MRRLIALAFLIALLISPVSATPASDTATQITDLLDKKLPYTVELTPSQINASGYNSTDLMHSSSTYKITLKSASYNAVEETAVIYINAWRDGRSLRVNNPVHWYVPFPEKIVGANAAKQLQNFMWMVILYADGLPEGAPIADDTLVIYPTIDGWLQEDTDGSWQTLRDATGDNWYPGSTDSTIYVRLASTSTSNVYDKLIRGAYVFGTGTPLAANSTTSITSAHVYIRGYQKTNGLGSPSYALTAFTPTSSAGLQASDYNKFGDTLYSNEIAYADFNTAGYNDYTLTASGITAIPITANNNFTTMFRDSWDYRNSFGGSWSSATNTGQRVYSVSYSSNKPYMVIVYSTGGDTTPPSSITGLTNTTPNCGNVSFNWTNPSDSDYNGLMLWRNNTALTNLTNSSTSVFWDGLPENTDITFSSKTFDFVGNVNATFVNKTAHTPACPTPPTPTPTPTTTPLAGCTFVNMTGITIVNNSSSWEIAEGNKSWGVLIVNWSQGNVSHYGCIGTPITTAIPNWVPVINPSVSRRSFWCGVPIIKDLLNWC